MNLERILRGFDKYIKLKDTDTIFITEPSYPGIEKRLALLMDEVAMLGADAMVKCLEMEGVTSVFGYPGVAICPLITWTTTPL